ncbi:hypothetical protein N0V93_002001 [Gnomoniopsis smithogilvyi]|uniref:Glucoamylase n=1 Tax=Gnomoniopsis smithogilvyi TaxID=1191159 RepID=A0A9W8Z4X4_9PEZI|nr:hypothetical protein N0V93_002001 [Gnomoniopsis smithogilvyi]
MLLSLSRSLLTSGLALGVGARAAVADQNVDVDSFVSSERAIALQGALNNIGPDGSEVPGASAGLVVASPSKANPNYFYTWTRDSALTLRMIVDEYILGNEDLVKYVEDYLSAQAALQTITNPSGTFLPSGAGLGEPKYMVDGTRFNGAWGRPQRDGPALRAITLIEYSWTLISQGQEDKVKTIIWPVIQNDLSYVGQYWNTTGFDLWEEVEGSSFFTTQNQYRALVEGTSLAAELGETCTGCDQAPEVLCFLQSYWNGDYYVANKNLEYDAGRTGIDANTILGPISIFDVEAACDSPTLQPCHSKSLANFKVFVDTFRNDSLYPINAGLNATDGVAVGRYPEDVYYGGNPWYLITLGAAEFLYDAVASWTQQCQIVVDSTSLSFFQDLYPDAEAQTYTSNGTASPFTQILNTATAYADSFVAVAQQYTPANGSLSEQFNKTLPGNPISAYDLTWSFASFVTMAQRRAGEYPRTWTAGASVSLPSTCSASSTAGTYAPAVAAGAPDVTELSTCTSNVLFTVNASTYFGENVYLVGSSPELGSWNIDNSQPLSAANYTSERPLWYVEVAMTAGETVDFVYAKQQDCNQGYLYESINRTVVVPACVSNGTTTQVLATVDDTWTGSEGASGNC